MPSIVEIAQQSGRTNTLVEAIKAAGLEETLSGEGPFTVFAPVDKAFSAIPKDELDKILADPELLKRVLLYHVVNGRLSAADVVRDERLDSLEGAELVVTPRDGAVMINAAKVVEPDIAADNGVVHLIDLVIVPQTS